MLSQSCTMEAEPASQVVTRSGGRTTRANLASAPALPQQLWKTQDWVVPVWDGRIVQNTKIGSLTHPLNCQLWSLAPI